MANTVNAALKPLETLSRIVNQPSSLFGGKGGSNKNKAEHDNVGTARDSNSNAQDQGILISQIGCFSTLDPLIPTHVDGVASIPGESGEAEPVEGNHRVQGTDSDLMDGETEGDTVVIAGQPEVLSTQAMQVINALLHAASSLFFGLIYYSMPLIVSGCDTNGCILPKEDNYLFNFLLL